MSIPYFSEIAERAVLFPARRVYIVPGSGSQLGSTRRGAKCPGLARRFRPTQKGAEQHPTESDRTDRDAQKGTGRAERHDTAERRKDGHGEMKTAERCRKANAERSKTQKGAERPWVVIPGTKNPGGDVRHPSRRHPRPPAPHPARPVQAPLGGPGRSRPATAHHATVRHNAPYRLFVFGPVTIYPRRKHGTRGNTTHNNGISRNTTAPKRLFILWWCRCIAGTTKAPYNALYRVTRGKGKY